ncbi:MAG: hypothetical protein WB699_15335 [Bacteroidota bacterium]
MNISILDASNYFKGVLLLIRKDRKITEPEVELVKHIGKSLGFEPEFCTNAINEILENRFIIDSPPVFSTKELALKFVKDGLAVAFSDNRLDPAEEQWLKETLENNGFDEEVFPRERKMASARQVFPEKLEVDDLTVEHSKT